MKRFRDFPLPSLIFKPPAAAVAVTVGEYVGHLVFDGAAVYRLQGLAEAPSLEEISNPKRALRAVSDFVWALWWRPAPDNFTSPEEVARAIMAAPDGTLEKVADAMCRAISAAAPPKEPTAQPAAAEVPTTQTATVT